MAEKEKEQSKAEKKTDKKESKAKDESKTTKKVKTVKKPAKKTKTQKKKVKSTSKPKDKVNVYTIEGKTKGKVALPSAFFEDVRCDLIRKTISAYQANRRQPYGPSQMSGMMHAVSTWGKGRGVSRVQRFSQGRTAAESPNNVGGRRAHPPRVSRNWSLKVNKKEKGRARNSALSATKEPDLVVQRGHKFDDSYTLPIIVENAIEKIKTTKEAKDTLKKLGVGEDLARAKSGIHIRAGRGKMRGRRYRRPKSLLLVVRNHEKAKCGFGNLAGVDVTTPEHLNIELLAPGGMPGRLTLFSEGALKRLEGW